MRHLRRIQSESSLEPHSTLEGRPKDWIRSRSKQHQARPHFPASTAPAKLECCETLASQNNELQNLLREQEEQIQSLQDTVRKLIDANNLLTSKLSERMKESISLKLKAASLDHELETLLNDQRNISQTINELQVKVSKLSLLPEVTPRVIIVIKMLEILNKASQPLSGKGTCTSLISLDNRRGTNLRSALDTLLSTDEAQILFSTFDKWFGIKALQSIALVTCFVCKKVKFRQTAAVNGATPVNEFTSTGITISCDKAICSVCYLKSVSYSLELLQETWWTAQGSTISILCPCRNHCDSIPMDDRRKLIKLLQMTNDDWLKIRKMKIYDTALHLMKILNKIEPKLTTSARQVAARMHRKMMANGFMRYPFDMGYWDLYHTETGSPLQANSKFVQVYNVEHGGGTLSIPVFTRFLCAEKEPADCAICAESICDISYGSIEKWTKVCAEFNGNWMWRVLLFPQKLGLQCNHTIDFCTTCLQRHIRAQLEQFGRSACDNITCPSTSCERLLTYEELQIYAQEDIFSRYDDYLKLKALSQMPSFMWCLSENCSSGQIHDLLLNSHVVCADCEFEMCFTHQVKWHEGLSCEQFDSLKETGDPEFRQTQEWIKTNTKPCPECDIQVQKGSGCFHMTCQSTLRPQTA
ncbi:uncharacterized protein B0J16DRAFT_271771 [Fusarium flagelliforme]|uniref:uncharacterized protein n=1 Tax=Fusarium flagelliforme TaxID=2675880 RepID=UPI001E8E25CB|nr:uncharacterized protein B0J16DRAFT_271771 [Fusarium flagelliforme]KAH7180103.1 hypothetical protein B0J16DRAFT_271771 [Fusarium flagelliforme]